MADRSTCTFAAASATLVLLAAPALAQAQSADGYYQGTLVCEQMPNSPGILRAPLDMIVNGGAVVFARPVFNLNGTRALGSEIATGSIEGDTLHVNSIGASLGAHYQAEYSGTIHGRGGVLTGTQTWTLPNGTRARGCVGAFVKARWQPPGTACGGAGGGGGEPPSE